MWTRTPRDATAHRQTEAANYKPERGPGSVVGGTMPGVRTTRHHLDPVDSVSSGKYSISLTANLLERVDKENCIGTRWTM